MADPKVITEEDYPIEVKWVWESLLALLTVYLIILICLLPLFFVLSFSSGGWVAVLVVAAVAFFFFGGFGILAFVVAYLSRANFHYSMEEEFLVFHQGIITKQQKNLPYGVIQNLILSQGLADRLLGLFSLTIENASFGGGMVDSRGRMVRPGIGFLGNMATIPGMTFENAQKLKTILLSKMKEFPTNSTSGL